MRAQLSLHALACLLTRRAQLALYFGLGHESQFVFDAEVMREIARGAVEEGAGDMQAIAVVVERELRRHYPKCVRSCAPPSLAA